MTARWRVELGEWKTLAEQREAAYRLLGQLVGGSVVVEHDASGAPFLPALPDLHVSISHCRKAVAVAVNEDAAIGIDIESRRRVSSGLVERVCTAMEREAIEAAADHEMEFLRFWTCKEAVLKMRRTGIRGFGSMIDASSAADCIVEQIGCGCADVVAAVALAKV